MTDLIKSEEQTISKVTVMNKVHGIPEELPIPEPEQTESVFPSKTCGRNIQNSKKKLPFMQSGCMQP